MLPEFTSAADAEIQYLVSERKKKGTRGSPQWKKRKHNDKWRKHKKNNENIQTKRKTKRKREE